MSISEIYAFTAIMGLHLSPSARHERAYSDLMTLIDEGNALTIEECLQSSFLPTAFPAAYLYPRQ
jgi:hypothetical protein